MVSGRHNWFVVKCGLGSGEVQQYGSSLLYFSGSDSRGIMAVRLVAVSFNIV